MGYKPSEGRDATTPTYDLLKGQECSGVVLSSGPKPNSHLKKMGEKGEGK